MQHLLYIDKPIHSCMTSNKTKRRGETADPPLTRLEWLLSDHVPPHLSPNLPSVCKNKQIGAWSTSTSSSLTSNPPTPLPPFNESSTPATLADIWMHFTADCHLPHKMLECIGSFVMFEASHSLLSNVYTLLTFYLYQLTSKIICYCHKTFF